MVNDNHVSKGIDLIEFRIRHEREAKARDLFYADVDSGLMPHTDWALAPLHVRQLYRSLVVRSTPPVTVLLSRSDRLRRFLVSLLP